jgi:hypothetical protein
VDGTCSGSCQIELFGVEGVELLENWDSDYVTAWTMGVRFSAGARNLSFRRHVLKDSGSHTGGSFPACNLAGA